MTQYWDKSGVRYAATLVRVTPLNVTKVKTEKTDGYKAIQVGFGKKSPKKVPKPLKGHLKKSDYKNTYPRTLKEIHISDKDQYQTGDQIKVEDILSLGDKVDVSGTSKGRGFAGVIKRWGFHGGPRTHGQSDRERAPGSIGQGTDPGRVHKGKKMPGRYGNQRFTIRNLTVLYLDSKAGEVALSGPIPGAKNSLITIKKTGTGEPVDLIIDTNDKNESKSTLPKGKPDKNIKDEKDTKKPSPKLKKEAKTDTKDNKVEEKPAEQSQTEKKEETQEKPKANN